VRNETQADLRFDQAMTCCWIFRTNVGCAGSGVMLRMAMPRPRAVQVSVLRFRESLGELGVAVLALERVMAYLAPHTVFVLQHLVEHDALLFFRETSTSSPDTSWIIAIFFGRSQPHAGQVGPFITYPQLPHAASVLSSSDGSGRTFASRPRSSSFGTPIRKHFLRVIEEPQEVAGVVEPQGVFLAGIRSHDAAQLLDVAG
jgi:hypothetical protein